ncbi:MAG: lipid-binding SYLF domain-containing protein [Planctomycetota bacterium]|jgi:lipid-binding SYLF domain-containing protein
MKLSTSRIIRLFVLAAMVSLPFISGCSTAPKAEDRESFYKEARAAKTWFYNNVNGLDRQVANSGGYIIFPGIAQYGILFGGGRFGRGMVCRADGTQVGWAALNTASIGLQAGVQGFKMLMVMENDFVMSQFKEGKLTGSFTGVAVGIEAGGSGSASFTDGVAMYQGANTGLMGGVNVGGDLIRFAPLGYED